MKKILNWVWENALFVATLFLLAFIPLYPKIPLVDVRNTWVYIRAEDFVVFLVLGIWVLLLMSKKITLKTPITLPILAFWLVGAIATLHGVIIIFPQVANVFPNVAFLVFIRHIEYVSLFFVAFASMRDKNLLKPVITVLVITLIAIITYGVGQKYAGFPAYLTMNEEFAKGVPIQLSELGRVPSTFAGHYDLAAYLVLIIPILVALIFGFKNWIIKLLLGGVIVSGFGLMFMTVSRVSFVVLIFSLFLVLFFLKKRLALISIPVAIVGFAAFLYLQPTLLSRFSSTISEVDVVINAETGESIGHVRYVPVAYLRDKIVKQRNVANEEQLDFALDGRIDEIQEASPSGEIIFERLPAEIPLVFASNVSTGENLPQGTGYINLSLSPVTKRLGNFFYELGPDESARSSVEVVMIRGDFIVKRAAAYDLSFTTRFQGGWPNAIDAFKRNILFGSGYGSVSLAVDNNYLRILGETGVLGLISFFAVFLAVALYIRKTLPDVDSAAAKTFVVGFGAGVIGLFLNATLIDVFEASKVAFVLWLLTGIVIGLLSLYTAKKINIMSELRNAAASGYAVVLYLAAGVFVLFAPSLGNYFVGDDFTWFRWVAECTNDVCPGVLSSVRGYFTEADGFFFRPGPKTYFHIMYDFFWLNQVVYHAVSLFLHFIVAALFYILSRKILASNLLAALAAFLFLITSGYLEAIYWISSTQYLFHAVFALASLLLFIMWEEKRKAIYLVLSIISITLGLAFHEMGVVVPLILLAYKIIYKDNFNIRGSLSLAYSTLFIPVTIYLIVRFMANSHWSGGDYSYNLIKLPFNIIGNIFGYLSLTIFGPFALMPYETLRNIGRENIIVFGIFGLFVVLTAVFIYKKFYSKIDISDKKIITFGLSFFMIALLPFLPLGNITSRYSYLASLGIVMILALIIKKMYEYLRLSGKETAVLGIAVLISVFSLFQIIQTQQQYLDWHGAGENAKRFFITINSSYSDYWSVEPMEFHFVDVPIKNGQAWVFPVGINDALWFAFQNGELTVQTHESTEDALSVIGGYTSRNVRVFEFEGDSVNEIIRVRPRPVPQASAPGVPEIAD